jgi:myosin heavy subunit
MPSIAMAPKVAPTNNHSPKVLTNKSTSDGDVRKPSMVVIKKGTSVRDDSKKHSFAIRRLTKRRSKPSLANVSTSKDNLNAVVDTSIGESDQAAAAAAASVLPIQSKGQTNLNSEVTKMSEDNKQVTVNQTITMELEQEREHVMSKLNKLEADMDTTILDYETKILDLELTHSNEIEGIKNEKDQNEDKLATLQDEHVWTSAQLVVMKNEISSSKDAYESLMRLKKQMSMHKLELAVEDKKEAIAKATKLEADIDTAIQEYETRICSLTMLYSDEINNIKGDKDKERLENKLTTLQDEHTRTNQQLQSTQNELTVKTSTYETHIKMLESQQTRSEEKTQQKIKALEQELESIRAYQNYSNPMISRALPQSTTSSQTKQGTSDEASLDSEVVAVGSSIDPGGGVEKRRVKTTHVVSGEEFVDMDAFDASSLSSACSSTSYDA